MCLQPQISQRKLGQIGHVGGVLKTSGPADSKSVYVKEYIRCLMSISSKSIIDYFLVGV